MNRDEIYDNDLESILKEFSTGGGTTDRMPEEVSYTVPQTPEMRVEEPAPRTEDTPLTQTRRPQNNTERAESGNYPESRAGTPNQTPGDETNDYPEDIPQPAYYGVSEKEYTSMPLIPLTEGEYIEYTERDLLTTVNPTLSASRAAAAAAAPQDDYYPEDEYEEDIIPEPEGKGKKRKNRDDEYGEDKPKNKWIAPLVIVVVLAVAAVFGIRYAAQRVDALDTIYPNVYLNGIPLGKLTREEAAETLKNCNWEKTVSGSLEVRLPMNVNAYVDYVDAGVRMSAEEAIDTAMTVGREDDIYRQLYTYVNSMILTTDIVDRTIIIDEDYVNQQLEAGIKEFDEVSSKNAYEMDFDKNVFTLLKGAGEVKIDQQALYAKVENALRSEEESVTYRIEGDVELKEPDFEKILNEERADAQNAYYDPEKDEIVDDVVGLVFDPKTASKIWQAAEPLTVIEVPLDTTKAEVTKKDLEEILFRDVLGEYTTSFKGSNSNRCSNINLAVNTINGVVVMPGETFSYNETLGERTEEKGYLVAAVYDNGEVKQGIGGGICQVSSTLCCAVRQSRLDYTRANHQFKVSYIDIGLDATVDYTNFEEGGGVDFTFTNTKDQPVKIVGSCDNDKLTVTFQILGTDYDHYTVEFKYKFVCYLKHSDAFPGDTDHSPEYNSTIVGEIFDAWAEVYDEDGNFVEKIYNEKYDRCWYLYHEEDRSYPYEPDASVPDDSVGDDVPT